MVKIWLQQHVWLLELFFFLALLILLNAFFRLLLSRAKKKASLPSYDWRHHLEWAALAPLRLILSLLLIGFAVDLIDRHAGFSMSLSFIGLLRDVGLSLVVAWFLFRWKRIFKEAIVKRRAHGHADIISVEITSKVATIAIFFLTGLVILHRLGVDILPLMTFGGIGAAAAGIAGRDVIANFFGGFMLYATRPFTMGEQIELPSKQLIGYIEEIGWYFTSIRDLEKRAVYIPNATFATEMVINLSRRTRRRIDEVFPLRNEDLEKAEGVISQINAYLFAHPAVDQESPLYVHLERLGPYSVDIAVRAYLIVPDTKSYHDVKQKILLEICRLIADAGAISPYPTMTIFTSTS